MRNREEKHKFKESKIGKIIYGFLMFAPLLAIGVTCGYVMFNKNAFQSYAGKYELEYKYQTNDVNSVQDLVEGRIYTFTYQETEYSGRIGIEKLILGDDLTQYNMSIAGSQYDTTIRINYSYLGTNYDCIAFSPLNNEQVLLTSTEPLNFIYGNTQFNQNIDYLIPMISKCNEIEVVAIEGSENSLLSNVFYYSVDKVEQSNLFNWSKTSNIYTGMHNFTTALNVTNTFIPMLLTYWLIISVIYFLYDIVLILLTVLHRKIHNLQDSI